MNQVKLVVVGGAAKATELVIRPPVVLGRGHEASIPLPHPLVSRLHCEIVHQQGRLLVRDLGSLNGTFVGNQRVSEAELPSGELLTVGSVTFRAEYEVDTDLFAPVSDADVSPEHAPAAAEDSRLSVAELPAVFQGQAETDDHPVDQLASSRAVIDEFPEIQDESPPLAVTSEPELLDAEGDSQLSIADLPVAFAVSPEVVSSEVVSSEVVSPEVVSPEAAPLAVDVSVVEGAATPVPGEIPLATVLEIDRGNEVEVDEDAQIALAVSGEETRDAVELEREDGGLTADVRPAPASRPDSLDFSVAPELNGSDSGTRSVYDSTMDEDLQRFLKNLE